jgi:hypothetical protein
MKRAIAFRIAAAGGLLLVAPLRDATRACEDLPPPFRLVVEWPRDAYLLVLSGGPTERFTETRAALEGFARRVNLKIADGAGGGASPGGVVVSPRGRVLARFDVAPGEKEIASLVRSLKREEIVRGLSANSVLVLVYRAGRKGDHRGNMNAAREAAKAAEGLFENASIGVVELDVSDTTERLLCKNLGIEGDTEGFVVVFGKGRTVPPVPGPVAKQAVLDRLQYLLTATTCVFPHELGEDLLLEW